MSGLLGVWNSQQPTPWQSMLSELRVLGSDGVGDWHNPQVKLSLGRTQFFNTPESCTEAPVVEYEGCVLVWQGRIDDRASLLTGRVGVTDAQLLIESYRRWGANCVDTLTGEFAFILWDAVNDILLVGCDPVGKHTLAYTWDGQTLLLCSRVLTLLRHPQVSRELDPLYLAHTLCSFYGQVSGSTPFTQIKRLLPGQVLVLKAGHLTEQQVSQITLPDQYNTSRTAQSYQEEFWSLLNQSVKDRLRSIHKPCTTLSGGLDSTTVTVSLLNHLPTIDAFSTVTNLYPEFDERKPIEAFLARYPQTQWHPVNSDNAWALSEPWGSLPITDDPLVLGTLPMNLHLMNQVQQQGFGLIFDGEWGDEIFAGSLQDLIRVGSWAKVQQYLKHQDRWHSVLWWEAVLPRLSTYWQGKWFARYHRRANVLPPWLTPRYVEAQETKLALQQYYDSMLSGGLHHTLMWAMASGFSMAKNGIFSLILASHGLQTTSPLQGRRLMEFAACLPPALQCDPIHGKIFLREANQSTLPPEIAWRPKDNCFDPLKYAGIGKGHQALELLDALKNISILSDVINISQVESALLSYRQQYAQNYTIGRPFHHGEASWLCDLLAFVNWYQHMTHSYS